MDTSGPGGHYSPGQCYFYTQRPIFRLTKQSQVIARAMLCRPGQLSPNVCTYGPVLTDTREQDALRGVKEVVLFAPVTLH